MAVGTPVLLDGNGTSNDGTSYPTASITPTANRLVIACGNVSRSTNPASVATISGCGITNWTKIHDQPFFTAASPNNNLIAFWGWSAAPTAGALTFSLGATSHNGFAWSVYEVPGVDLTTPIVQAVEAVDSVTGTTASVSLATIASSNNGLFAVVGLNDNPSLIPRASWTELHNVAGTSPTKRLGTQYRLGVTDNASATWAGGLRWAIIAFELAAASGTDVQSRTFAITGTATTDFQRDVLTVAGRSYDILGIASTDLRGANLAQRTYAILGTATMNVDAVDQAALTATRTFGINGLATTDFRSSAIQGRLFARAA